MIGLALTLEAFGPPPLALLGVRLPSLWATLSLAYLGAGAALAWHLGRHGHGLGTATTALACWPLLLGLIGRPPPRDCDDLDESSGAQGLEHGPNRARIDACLTSLRQRLAEDVASGVGDLVDARTLVQLARSLHRADHRIARVDRLLQEGSLRGLVHDASRDAQLDAALAGLRSARDHSQRELEAVLSGLLSLRVQLGLFALAGDSEPVRERLAELEARVSALAELSSIELREGAR